LFDPKTIERISGEVVSVETVTPIRGMHQAVHLIVKTEKETISVHLGPAWFIENQDVKIMLRDKVEITGSRITFQGNPAIIASEVRKGDQVLKLKKKTDILCGADGEEDNSYSFGTAQTIIIGFFVNLLLY
jgi:hypothetical protein